jgi:hypothetical protein
MPKSLMLIPLLLVGCTAHKPVQARLVVPPECVDRITLLKPFRPDGKDKPKLKIEYHCTKIEGK